jgi:hypothetical protein
MTTIELPALAPRTERAGHTVVTVTFEDGDAVYAEQTGLSFKAASKAYKRHRGAAELVGPDGRTVSRKAA